MQIFIKAVCKMQILRIQIYNSISEIMFGYWFSIFFCFCGCTKAKNDFFAPSHSQNCISWESSVAAFEHFASSRCRMQMDIVFHIERNGGNNFVLQHYFLPSFYANLRCFNGPIFMQHTCETHREREWRRQKLCFVLFVLNCACDQFEMAVHRKREMGRRHSHIFI